MLTKDSEWSTEYCSETLNIIGELCPSISFLWLHEMSIQFLKVCVWNITWTFYNLYKRTIRFSNEKANTQIKHFNLWYSL